MLWRRIVATSFLGLFATSQVHAGVITVGPGLPYAQISSALTVAHDGDVLLVKSGVYDRFTVNARAVTIAAEVGADVVVQGIEIKKIKVGQTVVLDRIQSIGGHGTASFFSALTISSSSGSVRAQACSFVGAPSDSHLVGCNEVGASSGAAAVVVFDSKDAAFTQCSLQGGPGADLYAPYSAGCQYGSYWFGGDSGHAIRVENSVVTIHDSSLIGANGGDGSFGGEGGAGIFANKSKLVLVDDEIIGGDGGESYDPYTPSPGEAGAHGMTLGNDTVVHELGSTFVGGAQGDGLLNPGGSMSSPIEYHPPTSVTHWSGDAKEFGTFKLVRESQSLVLGIAGRPGETILVFASSRTAAVFSPSAKGVFSLDPSALIGPIALGTVVGTSPNYFSVLVPELPAGVMSTEVYLQGVLASAQGFTLTAWGHVTVLDASL